ncbi:MAG: hypothetical protein OIF47_07100 [Marinibacterium sp.]|nr:hypothetical protein [Marinibacterium sp.]
MYDPTSPLLRPAVSPDGTPNPEGKVRFAEDRLLDAVIWCELRPSETVTEADVTKRFGLTKAAARAGLARLGYDGWAAPQPRTGWQVLPISGALIGQIIEARRIAEPSLSGITLDRTAHDELEQIARMLQAVEGRSEPGAVSLMSHYLNRVDGIMLERSNPFTARHLRKLWHHTARITHYFDAATPDHPFRRSDGPALIRALCAGDTEAIVQARAALMDAQQAYFTSQLLNDRTPLTRVDAPARTRPPTQNRRDT